MFGRDIDRLFTAVIFSELPDIWLLFRFHYQVLTLACSIATVRVYAHNRTRDRAILAKISEIMVIFPLHCQSIYYPLWPWSVTCVFILVIWKLFRSQCRSCPLLVYDPSHSWPASGNLISICSSFRVLSTLPGVILYLSLSRRRFLSSRSLDQVHNSWLSLLWTVII